MGRSQQHRLDEAVRLSKKIIRIVPGRFHERQRLIQESFNANQENNNKIGKKNAKTQRKSPRFA